MIVNVYAHLVDEMKSKTAFILPKVNFKAQVMPKLVAKISCQDAEGRSTGSANNVFQFNKSGRGGVI